MNENKNYNEKKGTINAKERKIMEGRYECIRTEGMQG
jgi:hypothetical protein